MKKTIKCGLSLLLVLMLLVSVMSGLLVNASAATYIYNWGTRGTTATYLSDAAQEFYSTNDTSYAELSALSGSSTVSAVPSSALYSELKQLMTDNHKYITSYSATKDLFKYTDCENGGGKISSFYSGLAIGPTWDGGWNREHTWPNSKGLEGSDEDDIMMLRPTSASENTSRGNTAYGEGSAYYDPNSESNGTYNLHGDVARIVLYVYVRWGNTSNMWGTSGVIESKEVLLKWMEEDPVDTWELGRNDAVESITGTRNVFVDYPELAFLLFDEDIPVGMTTPSGEAGSNYDITAIPNDPAMGSVSVSGNNINAIPAAGYMASGYTVLSGTATVKQDGNTFKVIASSDCQIQINFAPKQAVTVTYMSNGAQLSMQTSYTSDSITLPEYTGTAPEGYTFFGWSDVQVYHEGQIPVVYKSGDSYTVSNDTNIYAVFSYKDTSGNGPGVWTLVTDASRLSAGTQIVIASNEKGYVAGSLSGAYLSHIATTFSDDYATIPAMPSDALIFTLGGSKGAWTFKTADGRLLGATAVKKLAFGSGTTTWSITISNGNATIQNGTSSYGRFLYNVGYPRFTTYTSSTSTSMLLPQLYMLDTNAASTVYTTATCFHEDTEAVEETKATCAADGYTAGVFCNDCSTYISGHEVIKAEGHTYEEENVTGPGELTRSCSCGAFETEYTLGWSRYNGSWYYRIDDNTLATGWYKVGGNWFYMNTAGVMQTGWLTLGSNKYYLHSGGAMATGLTQIDGSYYCFAAGGAMRTGWQTVNGVKYLFGSDGAAINGWYKTGGNWYYLAANGAVVTGWYKIGGNWYYMDAEGVMQTGWVKVGGNWYYMSAGGVMQTGWVKVGSNWYYMSAGGAMQTGWVKVGSNWYYMSAGGAMQTGWVKVNNTWYYLSSSGAMVTGTQTIDGKTYTFSSSGAWIG